MLTTPQANDLHFDQTGTGPAILFLHDDPTQHAALFRTCASLAASNLRVMVALTPPGDNTGTQVVSLLKQLGIGRAVVIAIGQANYTLLNLLELHPDRIAAASFVAGRALVKELRNCTADPHIHALLRSGRRASVAKAVAKTRRSISAYGAVQAWAARVVDGCRAGLKNCASRLARLELPGLIQLDDGEEDEEIATEAS